VCKGVGAGKGGKKKDGSVVKICFFGSKISKLDCINRWSNVVKFSLV